MSAARPLRETERNQEATVYIGNIDENADDELVSPKQPSSKIIPTNTLQIYELMGQAGPLASVYLPKDRVNQVHQGFGFAEFRNEKDADYATAIMNGVRLYGKALRVNKALHDKQKAIDVGATLYIGNLDPMVDEKVLNDTFQVFGTLLTFPKLTRAEDGTSRGFGFVSFDDFEASDRALESMNGQYLMNKPIVINYAFKRDGKGERHGDEAERLLAQQAKKNNYLLPAQLDQQPLSTPLQQQQQQLLMAQQQQQIQQQIHQSSPAATPAFPAVPPPNFRGVPAAAPPLSMAGLPAKARR